MEVIIIIINNIYWIYIEFFVLNILYYLYIIKIIIFLNFKKVSEAN